MDSDSARRSPFENFKRSPPMIGRVFAWEPIGSTPLQDVRRGPCPCRWVAWAPVPGNEPDENLPSSIPSCAVPNKNRPWLLWRSSPEGEYRPTLYPNRRIQRSPETSKFLPTRLQEWVSPRCPPEYVPSSLLSPAVLLSRPYLRQRIPAASSRGHVESAPPGTHTRGNSRVGLLSQ